MFVIDGYPLFRRGVCASLNQLPDIEVAGESDVNEEVYGAVETCLPDVVLLGVDAGYSDGLKLCRTIKQRVPSVAVIVLTPEPDDDQLFQAIKAQASAYLSKGVDADKLAEAIRQCARGEHPINENVAARPKVAEEILEQFQVLSLEKETAGYISPLTPRETQILHYMAQGYLNKEIAGLLNVSEQTIKNHITSILRKLNVNARTQAVVLAIKKGLVTISRE